MRTDPLVYVVEFASIRNKKIGFIFQSFFLLPRLSALQNVMLPLFYRGIDQEIAKEKSVSILEKVGMKKFQRHHPNQLSGRQQQWVAIARALVGTALVVAMVSSGKLAENEAIKQFKTLGSDLLSVTIEYSEKINKPIFLRLFSR